MNFKITRAADRGSADYGWLQANYYFSFGEVRMPLHTNFGALRVFNHDVIAAGGGFPLHSHQNMEIITIPLSGVLKHSDSTGSAGVIKAGDVQIMSAGSGIEHAEANASAEKPVELFQIWIFPKSKNKEPRYAQITYDPDAVPNEWQVFVSALEEDNALAINQDVRICMVQLKQNCEITYQSHFKNSGFYILPINGRIKIMEHVLEAKDAIAVQDVVQVKMSAAENAFVLLLEVPMSF